MFIEIILFIFLVIIIATYGCRRCQTLPPGPTPFPIFGNLVQLSMKLNSLHVAFYKLTEFYGKVFSIRLGIIDMVVVNSMEAFEPLLPSCVQYDFSNLFNFNPSSLPLGDGYKGDMKLLSWDFLSQSQKNNEQLLSQELEELTSTIRSLMADGKSTILHMNSVFSPSIINFLWSITMMRNKRLYHFHNDPKLISLVKSISIINKSNIKGDWRRLLNKFMQFSMKINEDGDASYKEQYQWLHDTCQSAIKEQGEEVSECIKYLRQNIANGEQLPSSCLKFLEYESQRLNNTLTFGILYFILYPKVEQRIYQEISNVLKGEGLEVKKINLEDMKRMPYTEAAVYEIHRLANVQPLTMHRTIEDVKYERWVIPKDSLVIGNTYSMSMSIDNAMEFNPCRFLNNEEDSLDYSKVGEAIPLKLLGDGYKMTLFYYIVTLIRHFHFNTVCGHLDPSTEPYDDDGDRKWYSWGRRQLKAKPFNVVFSLR